MSEAALDTVYVTDAELIRRLGVPEKIARKTLRALDGNPRSGFPRKEPIWGDRRNWRAVLAYLDRNSGLTMEHPPKRGGLHVIR